MTVPFEANRERAERRSGERAPADGRRAVWDRPWFDPLLVFGLCLPFYIATLAPGLTYASPDANELIVVCATLGLAHPTGYPLYTWLGKAFTLLPVGSVAYRVNLMSAVLGAGGVAFFYAVVRLLGRARLPALFAALFFAFSRTFWAQATITETTTPNILMVALTLFFFLLWAERTEAGAPRGERYLLLGALSLGLSLGVHLSNLALLPACGLFVWVVFPGIWRRPRLLLGAGLLFALACLQFLWLPYKGTNLTDALTPEMAPITWERFYRYTLGAFPDVKFAFPLREIPGRIGMYLGLLRQNVGWLGIPAGLYGLVELVRRRRAHFFLLASSYLTLLVFFIPYNAPDVEVFFVPAHLLYIAASGYGVACGAVYLRRRSGRATRQGLWAALAGLAIVLALGAVVGQVAGNYARNDRSGDTAVEDFYRQVFQVLPEGSVLSSYPGVFGHDVAYFRLVEGLRPDLVVLLTDGPVRPEALRGREVFTTLRATTDPEGPLWARQLFPAELFPAESWFIPVLAGEEESDSGGFVPREMVLYRVSAKPPLLLLPEVPPQARAGMGLGGLYLEGYTLAGSPVQAGETVHLTLYWRLPERPAGLVATALGEQRLETHPLAFGNLERYLQEADVAGGKVVVEAYTLVVPSDTTPGEWPFRVGVLPSNPGNGESGQWAEIGTVTVGGASRAP